MQWHEEVDLKFQSPVPLSSFVKIHIPVDADSQQASGLAGISYRQLNDAQPGGLGSICWPVSPHAYSLICHKVHRHQWCPETSVYSSSSCIYF